MKTQFYLRTLFLCLLTLTFSCGSDDSSSGGGDDDGGGGGAAITSIQISANNTNVMVGNSVTFTVVANTGEIVTSQATISVNDAAISGSTYTPTTEGAHTVSAALNGLTSNSITINAETPPIPFTKHVLIEDYTGTWCGWCPRVAYGIEQVEDATELANVVAVHSGDVFQTSYVGTLESLVGLAGYPTAMLNRMTEWTYPEPLNVGQVVGLTGDDATLGLAVNATMAGANMDIEVSVKFGEDFSDRDLKLVVYVLEDGLLYDQENYTDYYGGGAVLPNFEHNHTLRDVLTNVLGDAIPSADTTKENVYTTTINTTVPANVSNSANINLVAFVVNGSTNKALNSRAADFGETQTFEEE